MCIAVVKPKDVVLTKKLLHKCYDNNADSWGFAYPADNGKELVVKRAVSGFRDFWKEYRDVPNDRPCLIHFRIATSGQVDVANCHPWLIDKKHALIHNGNIENKLNDKLDDNTSDTGAFVETILKPLFQDPKLKKKRFWASDAFKWLMEESIGYNNKMVILDATGFFTIYNEQQGEHEHGAWFSNKTYKEDRKKTGSTVEIVIENGFRIEITTLTNGKKIKKYLGPVDEEETGQFVLLPSKNEFQEVEIGELI
jgi:glutamine amidotransferase